MREVQEKFDFDNTISKLDQAGLLFQPQHASDGDSRRVHAEIGRIQRLPGAQRVPLVAAWVLGDCKFLST